MVRQLGCAVQLCALIYSCINSLLMRDILKSLSLHVGCDQRKPKSLLTCVKSDSALTYGILLQVNVLHNNRGYHHQPQTKFISFFAA